MEGYRPTCLAVGNRALLWIAGCLSRPGFEHIPALSEEKMKTIVYENVVDKSEWPRGVWDHEPDKVQWQDEDTGLPCLIVRNPVGALCGYVGVPEGRPCHGKEYDTVDVECHGGLTFAGPCQIHPPAKEHGILSCGRRG